MTAPSTVPVSPNRFMRLYRGQTHIDFVNRWRYWFALSALVIIVGMAALGVRGLNFSIDFKGGTVWEVPTTASVATVRADLGKIDPSLRQATITTLTNRETGKVNIEVQAAATATNDPKLTSAVTSELAKIARTSTQEVNLNAIGPSWGSDITHKAVEAVIVFLVIIAIYIWVRFEGKMAVAALVALLHDILVTVGIYALSGFQVSPDTVIAFLTILGYSLYDTIVVFDKVQENTRDLASVSRVTYTDVVNLSMNEVMARSINTSLVAIMPILSILVLGAGVLGATALNDFGLALLIGLTSGAYSSIFIASPLLAILKEREPRYAQIRERLASHGGKAPRTALTPANVAAGRFGLDEAEGGSRVTSGARRGRAANGAPTGRQVDGIRGGVGLAESPEQEMMAGPGGSQRDGGDLAGGGGAGSFSSDSGPQAEDVAGTGGDGRPAGLAGDEGHVSGGARAIIPPRPGVPRPGNPKVPTPRARKKAPRRP